MAPEEEVVVATTEVIMDRETTTRIKVCIHEKTRS